MPPPTTPSTMYYEVQKAGELDQNKKMEEYRMQMDAWREKQDELMLFMREKDHLKLPRQQVSIINCQKHPKYLKR